MGIEARETQTPQTATRTVVTEINPGMILQDLASGLDRDMIASKYAYRDAAGNVQNVERWMVDEMFKDPILKGKKPSKVKVLPFRFQASTPDADIKDVTFNPLAAQTSTTALSKEIEVLETEEVQDVVEEDVFNSDQL